MIGDFFTGAFPFPLFPSADNDLEALVEDSGVATSSCADALEEVNSYQ